MKETTCEHATDLEEGTRLASNIATSLVVLLVVVWLWRRRTGVWTMVGAATGIQIVGTLLLGGIMVWISRTLTQNVCPSSRQKDI
jgi:hypothetical protein